MRGKKAKVLRKIIYGNNFSPRHREYYRHKKTGTIVSDLKRQQYQTSKKSK